MKVRSVQDLAAQERSPKLLQFLNILKTSKVTELAID